MKSLETKSMVLLHHHLKALRLPTIGAECEKVANQAATDNVDHLAYLLQLTELELLERERKAAERRLKAARFPTMKTLENFDFTARPSVNKMLVAELARCEFIDKRENVLLIGNPGTGKSTLLRLIAGFDRPDAGTISLDDAAVDSSQRFVPPDQRRIGFVAQEGSLFPHLTAAKNIGFGLARGQRSSGRVDELLDLVGLGGFGGRYPHQLSGGQQQRVALARALAPRPRLVLLDEPFSSLDPALRSSLRADVMAILRDQHATTLLVTHDQSEALSAGDLVGVLLGGEIRQLATPEALYTRPADVAVAQFLGDANLISGLADRHLVHTALGNLPVITNQPPFAGPATVLVRPEQILVHRFNGPHPTDEATGKVVQREYFGHDCMLVISTVNRHLLRARRAGLGALQLGDTVAISVDGHVVAWPNVTACPDSVAQRQDLCPGAVTVELVRVRWTRSWRQLRESGR